MPRIDGDPSSDNLVEGVAAMVKRVASAWSGPPAPDVRLLPADLPFISLPPIDLRAAAVPIGIDENTLSPVLVDFDAEPHFIVIGDVESGKSNLLRLIARGITTRYTPNEAKIITFDYRRGLLGAVTTPHQIEYVMASAAAQDMVNNIGGALRERLAGIQVNPMSAQIPQWTGPKLFLLIDDYDLVATAQANPLLALTEFLPQARDIGLHVILSRAAGGAGRGMFDGVMQRLREMGSPGILLSGSKDEGAARLGKDGAVASRPRPTRASANRRDADPDRTHVDRRSGTQVAPTSGAPCEPTGA